VGDNENPRPESCDRWELATIIREPGATLRVIRIARVTRAPALSASSFEAEKCLHMEERRGVEKARPKGRCVARQGGAEKQKPESRIKNLRVLRCQKSRLLPFAPFCGTRNLRLYARRKMSGERGLLEKRKGRMSFRASVRCFLGSLIFLSIRFFIPSQRCQ
jgi:hypothetical protein